MAKTFMAGSLVVLFLAFAPATAQELDTGKALYDEFCVACHGSNGKGGGEISDIISATVPDLSKLAAGNDGEFPMLKVIHVIDGRTGVRAHGGPMPLYGNIFSATAAAEGRGYGSVVETRGRLLSLALYLESIQE